MLLKMLHNCYNTAILCSPSAFRNRAYISVKPLAVMLQYINIYTYIYIYIYIYIYLGVIRSSYWWDYIVLKTFIPNDWMENFWISRETSQYLCQKLQHVISHDDTILRKAISVEK